jgi:hypothetical protein
MNEEYLKHQINLLEANKDSLKKECRSIRNSLLDKESTLVGVNEELLSLNDQLKVILRKKGVLP